MVATVLLSRLGLAGTLVGAALAPIILTLVKELGRRPAERVIARAPVPREARAAARAARREREGGARPPRTRAGVRWGVVAVTSLIAFGISVAVVTVPELVAGRAVVADRPTTFFSSGSGDPGAAAPAPVTTDGERPTTTATTTTTTAPPAETTTTETETTESVPTETTGPPPASEQPPPAVTEPPAAVPATTAAPPPSPPEGPPATP